MWLVVVYQGRYIWWRYQNRGFQQWNNRDVDELRLRVWCVVHRIGRRQSLNGGSPGQILRRFSAIYGSRPPADEHWAKGAIVLSIDLQEVTAPTAANCTSRAPQYTTQNIEERTSRYFPCSRIYPGTVEVGSSDCYHLKVSNRVDQREEVVLC